MPNICGNYGTDTSNEYLQLRTQALELVKLIRPFRFPRESTYPDNL